MRHDFPKYMLLVFLMAGSIGLSTAAPAFADWGKDSIDKKVDHLKKELLLTDAQASQIKVICNETADKKEALMNEKEDRIKAVLTGEQKNRYDKVVKEWKENKQDKHDHKH